MRKLVQRAVVTGASMLAILSGVGGADLLGQARADEPECLANATDSCPKQANLPNADPPQLRTVCTGGGPMTGGAHCWRVPAPRINLSH